MLCVSYCNSLDLLTVRSLKFGYYEGHYTTILLITSVECSESVVRAGTEHLYRPSFQSFM